MATRLVSGNEAAAFAALRAGAKVICGYPGTPSSEVIGSLLKMEDFPGTRIEWSVNEKVAVEIAATASWAGKRALCTMKMSGLNVAYDSMIGISHSGAVGGLVIYVCDDPGVTTGMCEQDSRGFAQMSDMAMLEPGTVGETYEMVKYAFELSEAIQGPVFVRSVTNVAQSFGAVDIEERLAPDPSVPVVKKDINKYAKAGAVMCMNQHREAIDRLARAGEIIRARGWNRLTLAPEAGGIGIIAAGAARMYLEEGRQIAGRHGFSAGVLSVLSLSCSIPVADEEISAILKHCSTVIVLEELEPYVEREVYVIAHKAGSSARIIGKLDGTLSRIGSFNAAHAAAALCAAAGITLRADFLTPGAGAAAKALPRPITCCAGCPHRGTYMAVNKAIRNAGLKKEEVIVTGDIGCTILGMNPPFDTVWMEISMGASIPCAQGFSYGGVDKPIIATIGDSTFFHGGMPGLVNAIQHDIDMTVIIMDNGWTAMTGMQVNPNTAQEFQRNAWKNVDLVQVVRGMGVPELFVTDPFDQESMVAVLDACLAKKGLKVVVARRECAIQSNRRNVKYSRITVDGDKCVRCKICIGVTGCPAISLTDAGIAIDPAACNGCGLCSLTCPKGAIIKEAI